MVGYGNTEPLPVLPEGLDVIRPLGNGKMARVYLARERELDRVVAVKVLRRELSPDETARLRFEREARSVASLAHPNVVSVHWYGRLEDGTPFLVMTHVNGRTLADHHEAAGLMSETEARSLMWQLASALAAAHRKGIVHRDVRPENVLVEEDSGRFMLSDFGIAALLEPSGSAAQRLTLTGQIIGDPHYASPEQLRGEQVTPQADVYSLAIVVYESLTGEGPYGGSSGREIVAGHLTGDPRPITSIRPGLSADLEDLLLRCLHRQPSHRPRAEDILKRLESATTRTAEAGAHGSPPPQPGLMLMRRRFPQIVLSTLGAGVGLIGLVGTLSQSQRLPEWTLDAAINLTVWALLASMVLAWFHGERGRQDIPTIEKWILAVLAVGWLGVSFLLLP
jgi:serine/threonine protein kinase